ncbi:divalent cation tolerance protein CutA [Altererythrobacter buctensis]|uniref:Divalent cation tolerance protein CutA n=1 Tax=Alteraurantiacibacter buctensis TaxID=1503981 RepID=A0A844YUD2_9SPHN|nr:divalent-cation tolerance protein CutA [Alteraurantiacibacter buctensis]MXO70488.1 divalent cation tolerance protein CutA [Alteraurantiacibacter buctensis]
MVWCPFPDEEEARRVAGVLLDEGLIACANILPGIISLYVWNGERGEAREVGLLAKTNESLGQQTITRLGQLHSYQSPAIIGWKADEVGPATRDWLGSLTGTGLA